MAAAKQMQFTWSLCCEVDQQQVLFEDSPTARKVILNRPNKLNVLNYAMVSQILSAMEKYERDPTVNFVILKGKGRAFCAGGDVMSAIGSSVGGHWSYTMSFYRKQIRLDYLIATYSKPVVALLNGVVMGGGAGLSLQSTFPVVSENTVFAMPEALIGLSPDVGASYFLSRLPGYFGEYLGLTGARLDGAEMVACGLASHFVPSHELGMLEQALCELQQVMSSSSSSSSCCLEITATAAVAISRVIASFGVMKPPLKQDSPYRTLETTIKKCFSKGTVEEILSSLEKEADEESSSKWIKKAYSSMKAASPTSLKVTLKSIREGRMQKLEECLEKEHNIVFHMLRGSVNTDFYEGARALLFDKDKKPKWEPGSVEMVSEEMVKVFFTSPDPVQDPDAIPLNLTTRTPPSPSSKL